MPDSDHKPEISVILPCYNAAAVAGRSVEALAEYLPSVARSWEVLVVDDGRNDFGAAPIPEIPGIRLLRHARNRGKGAAVRTGILEARGKVRVFTDVDMPYDRELIPLMGDYIVGRGFHLVIGDRTLPGSSYSDVTSPTRRALSALASGVIGAVVTGGFFDTQCGIKAMRGDVADALFPLVHIDRFAFEVEVIYLALKHGLDIKRLPVRLRRNEGSSVRPFRDAVGSARDILYMKLRQTRQQYGSKSLETIVARELET